MKDLITSVIVLLLLLSFWIFFVSFAQFLEVWLDTR